MNACHEIFLFEMIVYYINNLTISFSSRYKQIIIICKSIYKIIEKQIVFTYFIYHSEYCFLILLFKKKTNFFKKYFAQFIIKIIYKKNIFNIYI